MRSTRAIIHLDYLKQNIKNIKALTAKNVKMCIPVKADAYGHGAIECAKAALECNVEYLAVATVDEGLELREAGIAAPILLFSLCSPEEIESAIKANITPFVFDKEYIDLFAQTAKKLGINNYAVHLAIDTGMGRIGCYPEEALELAKYINSTKSLVLSGMMTHFAVSDSIQKEHRLYTQIQFSRFMEAVDSVKNAGINPGLCHCANSAATLDLPETHLDMVRPGIIVYGYGADEINSSYLMQKGISLELKPVMTLETTVSAIRPIKRGMSIGYGRTWTATQDTDIAVLTVGYGDGFVRRFAENGITVSINGKAYPIRGRICMDQCMVEIGKNNPNVKRWDKVILFGSKEDKAILTADDIACATNTISYEITTVLTKRVPRVFIN